MSVITKKGSSDLEKAYDHLKNSLYQKFTQFTLFIIISTSIIEIARAIFLAQLSILLNPLGSLALGVFLYKHGGKRMLITGITGFNIVGYAISLYGHYSGTGYFVHPSDTFYFSYTFAFLERLVADRIPTPKEKAFFCLMAALLRILIVPLNDPGLFGIQLIILGSLIYFDFNQESHYKKLFRSSFQSKEQLGKFKDLVENYIPDEIIVIAQESKHSLFVNNAFKALFEANRTLDIRSQLNAFCISKSLVEMEIIDPHVPNLDQASTQTLLELINSIIAEGQSGSFTNQNSYHLTFSKIISEKLGSKEEKIFEARILNIIWDEVPAFAIILHDITQQQTVLELKIAADLNKDKVLATVSHELRTPLNAILGMVQIMDKKIQDPELLQYLKICKNSANLLIGLVNSILDLNQIRANKLKLFYDKVQLYELLKDIVYLFEFQCNQKNISLNLYISPRVPDTVTTDKNRLSQIFINLLGNALKFTMQGSITIIVKESTHPDMIQFSVRDTGVGIKEKDKDKLFMMYGRLDQDDNKINQQGVGLGLTISNNLAQLLCDDERLGGIKVESEYKKGSAFTFLIRKTPKTLISRSREESQGIAERVFDKLEEVEQKIKSHQTLPIKQKLGSLRSLDGCQSQQNLSINKSKNISFMDVTNPKNANSQNLPSLELKNTAPSVLIVDDNPFNITVATHLVSSQGFNVKSALYGQTAIDIALNNDYKTEPIELILMDCQMPIMDGYEATKILKKLMREGKIPEIPIIALTANNSEEDREVCRKAGMCDYLTKPLKEAHLVRALRKYFHGSYN